MPAHVARASGPSAQMAPTPVMTTRRFMAKRIYAAGGHLDLEVILDLESDLDCVQRRDLEILQRRVQRNLALVDAGFLGDDREYGFSDVVWCGVVAHGGFPSASLRGAKGGVCCASPPSNRIPATMIAEPRIFSHPIGSPNTAHDAIMIATNAMALVGKAAESADFSRMVIQIGRAHV